MNFKISNFHRIISIFAIVSFLFVSIQVPVIQAQESGVGDGFGDSINPNETTDLTGGSSNSNNNSGNSISPFADVAGDLITNYFLFRGAIGNTGSNIVDKIGKGVYILDACSGGVISEAVSTATSIGVDAGVDFVTDIFNDSSLGKKLGDLGEKMEKIPGVGAVVGGLLSGFFGSKNSQPQLVKEIGLRQSAEARYKKEQCYDALAREAADRILASFSDETRKWIQFAGDLGNPRFVTNLGAQLRLKADQAFNQYMGESETFSRICSSYRNGIYNSLTNNYYNKYNRASGYYNYRSYAPRGGSYRYGQRTCALEDLLGKGNTDVFLRKDFTRGGWNAWFTLVGDENSNPFTAYINETERLSGFINESRDYELETLRQGNGYLPDRRCVSNKGERYEPNSLGDCDKDGDGYWDRNSDGSRVRLLIATPGSLVSAIIEKVVESDVDRTLYADEMNEVVSSFANSLFGKITTEGLAYTGAGIRSSDSGLSIRLSQIRSSLLETMKQLIDLTSIIIINSGGSSLQIPIEETGFTFNDIQELNSKYGEGLIPINSECDIAINPEDEACNEDENTVIDFSVFRDGKIDIPSMFGALNRCSTDLSSDRKEVIEKRRQALENSYPGRVSTFWDNINSDINNKYTYTELNSVVRGAIAEIGKMIREIDGMGNPTEAKINDIDNRHKDLLKKYPHVGNLATESLLALKIVQQASKFQREINDIPGLCGKLNQSIDITTTKPTENTDSTIPGDYKSSEISWNYTDIDTKNCSAKLDPPIFDIEETLQIIDRETKQVLAGYTLSSAIKTINRSLVLYYNTDHTLIITCTNPSGYGIGDISRSRTISIPSTSGGKPGGGNTDNQGGGANGGSDPKNDAQNNGPSINIFGESSISFKVGETIIDPKAYAKHATGEFFTDNQIIRTVRKLGNIVNPFFSENNIPAGIYSVDYTVVDSDGTARAQRTVEIIDTGKGSQGGGF